MILRPMKPKRCMPMYRVEAEASNKPLPFQAEGI
jgi:hypothetical protein